MPIGPAPRITTLAPHRHGQRLNHGTLIIAEILRKRRNPPRIRQKELTGQARVLEPHDFQLFAEIVFSVPAGIALSADDLRFHRDFLANGQACHPFAQGRYLRADLMPLGNRVGGKGVCAVIDMDVTPAHPDPVHLQ